jgi:hypothetical protein
VLKMSKTILTVLEEGETFGRMVSLVETEVSHTYIVNNRMYCYLYKWKRFYIINKDSTSLSIDVSILIVMWIETKGVRAIEIDSRANRYIVHDPVLS